LKAHNFSRTEAQKGLYQRTTSVVPKAKSFVSGHDFSRAEEQQIQVGL
jgi:hypothetical protein